jgi:hypothetical protein
MAKNTSGGAAAGGGVEYQSKVAAWLAAHVLAEIAAEVPWDLRAPIQDVACETGSAVDDIGAGTAENGQIFIQAKRRLVLSTSPTSDLASALGQCVRQHLASPLDASRDRLVVAAGPNSAETVLSDLRRVLTKIRQLPAGAAFDAAASNQKEKKALDVVTDHVCREWTSSGGAPPELPGLRRFFDLLWVSPLALEGDDTEERHAKGLLRGVLAIPDEADAAWHRLVSFCATMISSRGRADRATFQRALAETGLNIKAAPSYRRDIERLTAYSKKVLTGLADYAAITLGDERIVVDRSYADAARDALQNGSLLLVGEPGAGKSGVLYALARALLAAGHDVVVLVAQNLPCATNAELRTELGLEHDLADVLANWPGPAPAFLLVDALDAARTEPIARVLRQAISHVVVNAGRWRAAASIREYDLRYGFEFRTPFEGTPPPGPDAHLAGDGLNNVRHLVVGTLTTEDFDQIKSQSTSLCALITAAPAALETLLKSLFNLRLAAELLKAGTAPGAIRSVTSQLDLLDLYWGERVLHAGGPDTADGREAVLRVVVERMVAARTLRLDRDEAVSSVSASAPLADILRSRVLAEWSQGPGRVPDRYSLTFAHHVLFDYAVARLLLRRNAARLAAMLAEDPQLAVIVRPSFIMHFNYLWGTGAGSQRSVFWESTLRVCSVDAIPELAKLMGPTVASERAETVSDLLPLANALKPEAAHWEREAAGNALNHLIRSLLIITGERTSALPNFWVEFAAMVSQNIDRSVAFTLRAFLSTFEERLGLLDHSALQHAGLASRRLLEFVWPLEPRDRWLVVHALQYVCRTFASDRAASAALLRRALEPDHLKAHGSDELPWLAREVPNVVPEDPVLVRDLYIASFGYREVSDAPVPMGGVVMKLISNRRQDYESALYALAKAFPDFLRAAPAEALRALSGAVESQVEREDLSPEDDAEVQFDVGGVPARLLQHHSGYWRRPVVRLDEKAIEMLDDLETRLSSLVLEDAEAAWNLVVLVIRTARLSAFWRLLLDLGTKYPDQIGYPLRSIAWTGPLLFGEDTGTPSGEFIGSIATRLSTSEREQIAYSG